MCSRNQVSAASLTLRIDGQASGSTVGHDGGAAAGQYLELAGNMYVGGIEAGSRQLRAQKQGVRTANISLQVKRTVRRSSGVVMDPHKGGYGPHKTLFDCHKGGCGSHKSAV